MDIMKLDGAIGLAGAICHAAYMERENELREEREAARAVTHTVSIPNSVYGDSCNQNKSNSNRDLEDITNKVSEATLKAIKSIDNTDDKNIIIINNIICS